MSALNLFELAGFDPERPKPRLLVDSEEARVVLFSIRAGQVIPAHVSPSRVFMYCAQGTGTFLKGDAEVPVKPGTLVACEPDEPHGMSAAEDMLVLAVIAPCP